MLHQSLHELCSQGRLAVLGNDPSELGTFCLGYICFVSTEHYVLLEVDRRGRFDGFHVGKINDIIHLSFGSEYEQAFAISINSDQRAEPAIEFKENYFDDMLTWAQTKKSVVRIRNYSDQLIYARILDFDDSWLKLSTYTNFGKPDGTMIIGREQLYRLYFEEPSKLFGIGSGDLFPDG